MYVYSIKNKPYLKIKSVKKGFASKILKEIKPLPLKKQNRKKNIDFFLKAKGEPL